MALSPQMEKRLREKHQRTSARVKHGDGIFEGTDYPRTWDDFIGQEQAKEQLKAAVLSAMSREVRLEHTLLASGLHGIGKTTLAYILAHRACASLACISGPVDVEEAREVFNSLDDGDVVFWDEFHLAVMGNRNRADWLLPVLTDGELMTANGAEKLPDVTVIAATTDAGKLPLTLISRFMVRPKLVTYTDHEARMIVRNLSKRMGIPVPLEIEPDIAAAANNNPRDMRMILTAYRDVQYTGAPDLNKAFQWAGLSADGLPTISQEILLVLLGSRDHTASEASLHAQLGEPGPLKHFEQVLLQRGLLTVTGRGRMLTAEGVLRAKELLHE